MPSPDPAIEFTLPPCPPAIQYLITDYGHYLGIADLALDSENRIMLDVSGTVITVEYPSDAAGLVLSSHVGALSTEPDMEFLLTLSTANHLSFRKGGGIVTLDGDTGELVWADRINPESLSVEMFDEWIKRSVVTIGTWASALAELDASTESEADTADSTNQVFSVKV